MKPSEFMEHPEGGRFCEVYRSVIEIRHTNDDRRCALTHIYFSLSPHEISCFHKVDGDEVWNLYQGTGLNLFLWDGTSAVATKVELSAERNEFCHVVPAGVWQAAVPLEDTVLVGCSVAPGFEFSGFEIMRQKSEAAKRFAIQNVDLQHLISTDT